jgi:AraC family transcriptional regulator
MPMTPIEARSWPPGGCAFVFRGVFGIVWFACRVHRFGGRDLARQEFSSPGVDLARVRWRTDEGTTGLTWRREHQIFVTLAGSTGRTRARLDGGVPYDGVDFPGAATFIPAFRRRRASYGGGTIDYLAIRLDPGVVASDEIELVGFTNRADPLLHQLAVALSNEARIAGTTGTLFADSVVTTIMLHLGRTASDRPWRVSTSPLVLSTRTVREVLEYIEEHLADDLRLSVLAGIAAVDRHRFSRQFKAATGESPHAYVTARRLDRAARLLRATDGPSIAEIAHRVGLSSQSHLTTLFRRSFGTTPAAYRSAFRLR